MQPQLAMLSESMLQLVMQSKLQPYSRTSNEYWILHNKTKLKQNFKHKNKKTIRRSRKISCIYMQISQIIISWFFFYISTVQYFVRMVASKVCGTFSSYRAHHGHTELHAKGNTASSKIKKILLLCSLLKSTILRTIQWNRQCCLIFISPKDLFIHLAVEWMQNTLMFFERWMSSSKTLFIIIFFFCSSSSVCGISC